MTNQKDILLTRIGSQAGQKVMDRSVGAKLLDFLYAVLHVQGFSDDLRGLARALKGAGENSVK